MKKRLKFVFVLRKCLQCKKLLTKDTCSFSEAGNREELRGVEDQMQVAERVEGQKLGHDI
jgi:hypothetical protein